MPFAFSGQRLSYKAKLNVVSDGDTFAGAPTIIVQGGTATLTQSSTTTTLTGGTGFVSGDTGKFVYITGAATPANNGWQGPITYVSATSVTYTNASGATDANNGHISWLAATLAVSTVASSPNPHTIFTGPPLRSATGVWSITTKDCVVTTLNLDVKTVLPTGEYLSVQQLPETTVATTGQKTYNWVFNVNGTPTDVPFPGSFRIWAEYSETKVGV